MKEGGKIGDRVKFGSGYGYWDLTKYSEPQRRIDLFLKLLSLDRLVTEGNLTNSYILAKESISALTRSISGKSESA